MDKDNIYLLDTNPGKKLLLAIPSKGIDLQEVVYTNNLIQTKDALYVKGKPDSFIKIPIKDFSTLKYFGDSKHLSNGRSKSVLQRVFARRC